MTRLEAWSTRTPEEANLFNPAFIGALTYEFVRDFSKEQPNGASLTSLIIALTASLHKTTRESLPLSTIRSLYEWLQENEALLIGFPVRARNLAPYIKEGVMFGLIYEVLTFSASGNLILGGKKAAFPKAFLDKTTPETKSVIDRGKFMGRWLSKSGSDVSIAAAWGIKP